MLYVVLDWQKISKTILEKVFFFILWCFYLVSVFVLINFKIGPSERWTFFSWNKSYGVSKNREFYPDFKKANFSLWQNAAKIVTIKKLFYILPSPIFSFFNVNFFGGHFVTRVSLCFWNQHKILDFVIPNMTYFKEKYFHLSEGPILKFFDTKTKKRYKRQKIRKNAFSKTVLYIFCQSKIKWSIAIF
jgi:hypothetical protein